MNWIQCLTKAINYMEMHLTDDIDIEAVSAQAFASSSHFQLVFHVVMGMPIGEYIRNRRMSLAAQELLQPGSKIIDVALKYRYDTQESFSKAFTRFHRIPPSKAQWGNITVFQPLTINITVQGGFVMSCKIIDEFHLLDTSEINSKEGAAAYQKLVQWAGQARGRNPGVFDALTAWLLDDSKWTDDYLEENEWIFKHGVLARFKEQNAALRALLKELEPSGVVNEAVFKALDIFDDELSGNLLTGSRPNSELCETVAKVFADFSIMKELSVREQIAGNKTGPYGTDGAAIFGYINYLAGSDAQVQWCLFMPDVVKRQQDGFTVESFEYKTMPAMRFIGKECIEHDEADRIWRLEIMRALDAMTDFKSGFDYDISLTHHYGRSVDAEPWHGFWGRFMKANTPVPEGFLYWDFVPDDTNTPYLTFRSQFAFATFSGDVKAMHNDEGTDGGRMYDVTRNIILSQGVNIPYPEKYWTAEVFFNGCNDWNTGFLFSANP